MAAVCLALVVSGCGGGNGSSAAPPTGFTVTPGNGQVVVTWQSVPGVDYWLMYTASGATIDMKNPPAGHVWATNISSPYVISGLTNGVTYSFAMNGRTSGGPGGAQTASQSAIPRYAGATWTSGGVAGSTDLLGLAYGTASDATVDFVAVGTGGVVFKGTDGINWTAVGTGPSLNFRAATYAFGKFIGVGAGGNPTNIYTSSDIATWASVSTVVTTPLNAVASNGTTVVAVGDGGTVYYSTDGSNWTPAAATATSTNLLGVAYSPSNASWVAVGLGGAVITSTDLATWTPRTSNTSADLHAVAVTPANLFVAVGTGGAVVRSTDGTNWSPQTLGATNALYAVSTDSVQFLAAGATGAVFTSADGISWTPSPQTASSAGLRAIVGSTSKYVVVGDGGANIYSTH
jgi:hypothetical protein